MGFLEHNGNNSSDGCLFPICVSLSFVSSFFFLGPGLILIVGRIYMLVL